MSDKIVLVLGASTKPERFSYKAINKLLDFGYKVIAVANKPGQIRDLNFLKPESVSEFVHTVTLYLGPENQKQYYDFILGLNPKRIIFNPGTENEELMTLARNEGIKCVTNCTLVMLDSGSF